MAGNPHHVCQQCGHIGDAGYAVGIRLGLALADDHGFWIDQAEVAFRGLPGMHGGRRVLDEAHKEESQ